MNLIHIITAILPLFFFCYGLNLLLHLRNQRLRNFDYSVRIHFLGGIQQLNGGFFGVVFFAHSDPDCGQTVRGLCEETSADVRMLRLMG